MRGFLEVGIDRLPSSIEELQAMYQIQLLSMLEAGYNFVSNGIPAE